MKILITGINGFIGQHLSQKLIKRGHKVSGLENEKGGVLNKKLVERAIHGSEMVVHLAALTSHKDIVENKFETLETNFLGTKNVLDAFSKSKKTRKFLFASTGKVYGKIVELPISENHPTNPLNILGKSKLITEKLIDFYASTSLSASRKEFVIFRIFNVYGPGQSDSFLIPTIISQLQKKEITLGDINVKRDYVYIDDVVNAFELAIENKGRAGLSIYNICTGKRSSASKIVKMIRKIKKIKIKVKSDSKKLRHDEMDNEYGSFAKAKKTFGWTPKVTIEQGIKNMIYANNKALILAGGEGTRMKKLFPNTPKLLIPIRGKPFLDYLMEYLKENNVGGVVISTGYLGNQVEKYLISNKYHLPIAISREKKPLGTGGAISFSKHMFNDDFFLLFGDVYTEVDLKRMFEFHNSKKAVITAVVHRSVHPESSNLVEFDSVGKITKVIIKPHGRSGKNLYNLAALYILSGDIGKYLPRKTDYDFEKDLLVKLVDENKKIYAYNTDETIMDFGTPERLTKLEKELRK